MSNYEKNKEKIRLYNKAKYDADPEAARARARASKAKRKDKIAVSQKAYREKNKDKIAEQRLYNRLKYNVNEALRRAETLGVPHDSAEDLLKKLESIDQSTGCPCCGNVYGDKIPLISTIDRVIPERGYVVDNVDLICHTCNRQKQDLDLKKIEQIASYIKRNTHDRHPQE